MDKEPLKILPQDLMDMGIPDAPWRVDSVYAQAQHPENMFREAIYRPGARFWLHRDFAPIVIRAAQAARAEYGLVLVLKDGLRTVEAQQKIIETPIVRANPHWLEPPRLFSPPGKGGHPRGMAVDVVLETPDGALLEMGTRFDYLSLDPGVNPAHREFPDIPQEAKDNRALLEGLMTGAASALGLPLLPLPAEWWDFRFPGEIIERYAPLSDMTLPPDMRMVL